eukprot:2585830-Rhodomonas_salina.1
MWPRFIFVPVSLVFNSGRLSECGCQILEETLGSLPALKQTSLFMLFYDDDEYDDTVAVEDIERMHSGLKAYEAKLVSWAVVRGRCAGSLVIDFSKDRLLDVHTRGARVLRVTKHNRLSLSLIHISEPTRPRLI